LLKKLQGEGSEDEQSEEEEASHSGI
jgi:hypothetical protein